MAKASSSTGVMEALVSRSYWRLEDAARVHEVWCGSGLSLAEFCRRWGLKRGKLDRWWRVLRETGSGRRPVGSPPPSQATGFVEWLPVGRAPKDTRSPTSVQVESGDPDDGTVIVQVGRVTLRCPGTLSERAQRSWLRSVLEVAV